jgi:hypothetical protein
MAKAKPQVTDGATKCRVLVAGAYGEANSVIELSGDALVAASESGQVDPDPNAVAYAESLAVAQEAPAE